MTAQQHVADEREALAAAVEPLEPGVVVTATVAPRSRGTYRLHGPLVAGEGRALSLGGWEFVRLPDGTPPAYLRDVELDVAPPPALVVDTPGVWWDMPETLYHSGPTIEPSLSHSGAKNLARSPLHYRHALEHRTHKSAYDLGHVFHGLALGVGLPVRVVKASDWRTNAAKADRDEARAAGEVPILAKDYDEARRMVDALKAHPHARRLLDDGMPEVSMFDRDPVTGRWLRGRVDWLNPGASAFVDVKSARNASAGGFNKSVDDYGYAQQAAWYVDQGSRLDDMPDVDRFVFIVVESDAPYAVHVIELDAEWFAIGRKLNRQAIDLFDRCMASGDWPGYGDPDKATILSPPAYVRNRHADALDALEASAESVPIDPQFEQMLARLAGIDPEPDAHAPARPRTPRPLTYWESVALNDPRPYDDLPTHLRSARTRAERKLAASEGETK